jgi:hypothetical protein
MEPYKTNIDFTDEELKVLNDVLRGTKLTFSSEEALLIKLGRASNPMLDLTHRIALIYEKRAQEVAQPAPPAAPQAELSAE